jgi:hypothetical protein
MNIPPIRADKPNAYRVIGAKIDSPASVVSRPIDSKTANLTVDLDNLITMEGSKIRASLPLRPSRRANAWLESNKAFFRFCRALSMSPIDGAFAAGARCE